MKVIVAGSRRTEKEKSEMKKYKKLFLMLAVMFTYGFYVLFSLREQFVSPIGQLLLVGLTMTSLGFYARTKDRSPFWGLLGFCGYIGILIMYCISDGKILKEQIK